MALTGNRTFVGFGFGAIQAGLFLYEAASAGTFGRLVCAEIQADRIARVRAAGGLFTVNIAHADHIERAQVGPVKLLDPNDPADRAALIAAVAAADEAATALPSVAGYANIAPIVAAGLAAKQDAAGPPLLVYCAENTPQAADILAEHVRRALPPETPPSPMDDACFVDTVIAKMSGLAPAADGLAPIAPGDPAAFLVEAFNRILTGPRCPDADGRSRFTRGIPVFTEKPDLVPFEAAKLYCHNAGHATAAYLAQVAGLTTMDELTAGARSARWCGGPWWTRPDGAGAPLRRRGSPLHPAAMATCADDLIGAHGQSRFLRDGVAQFGPGSAPSWAGTTGWWAPCVWPGAGIGHRAGSRRRGPRGRRCTLRATRRCLRTIVACAVARGRRGDGHAQCVDLVTAARAQPAWRNAPVSTPWHLSA
ncbi:MAG: hypothetical protein R2851_06640 [Caldilineaceae bacterium]